MNTQILNLDFYGWGKNGMIENPDDVPLEDVFILRQDVLDIIKNLNNKEKILQAERLIIQGYYNRLVMQQPNIETIIKWLKDDLSGIQMDCALLGVENIINEPIDPHEVSTVKCDLCGKKWVAVRPEGLDKLECPNCGNMVNFENIGNTP